MQQKFSLLLVWTRASINTCHPWWAEEEKVARVELCFKDPSDLQTARLAVKPLDRTYSDGRYVWLDAKKERNELKPARVVHRMADALEDVESQQDPPLTVEKFLTSL